MTELRSTVRRNSLLNEADKDAAKDALDRNGIPAVFRSINDGATFANEGFGKPLKRPYGLPLAHAPKVARDAFATHERAMHAVFAADEEAERLYDEYRAIPADAQRAVTAAVSASGKVPSISSLIDSKESELAPKVRDAIALRDALKVESTTAARKAVALMRKHRDEWRDNAATYVVTEIPKVRADLKKAIDVMRGALNKAVTLDGISRSCEQVDAVWLDERARKTITRISPYQVSNPDYDRASPDVFKADYDARRSRRENVFNGDTASQATASEVISAAESKLRQLSSYSNGGTFPDSLAAPLKSHKPVQVPPDAVYPDGDTGPKVYL
ncbi:hypothetical protein [Streptomyces sp. NRRL WC-3549]|uniref:hypothetical protein n=1 Tax=Streptomyces sp. NRRL WC-3549 TaxID=1463925 RepID=UPI0004CC466A|nr:hypothetical protein [Streptomyces sp. NRRL WC-3549]